VRFRASNSAGDCAEDGSGDCAGNGAGIGVPAADNPVGK
jgi:hypothetical protein